MFIRYKQWSSDENPQTTANQYPHRPATETLSAIRDRQSLSNTQQHEETLYGSAVKQRYSILAKLLEDYSVCMKSHQVSLLISQKSSRTSAKTGERKWKQVKWQSLPLSEEFFTESAVTHKWLKHTCESAALKTHSQHTQTHNMKQMHFVLLWKSRWTVMRLYLSVCVCTAFAF